MYTESYERDIKSYFFRFDIANDVEGGSPCKCHAQIRQRRISHGDLLCRRIEVKNKRPLLQRTIREEKRATSIFRVLNFLKESEGGSHRHKTSPGEA